MASKRVISPHLLIYKLPINAIFSIQHRLSGVVLYVSLIAILWMTGYHILTHDIPQASECLAWMLSSVLGRIILWCLGVTLSFHGISGVRYLLMDFFGFGLHCQRSLFVALSCVSLGVLASAVALFCLLF